MHLNIAVSSGKGGTGKTFVSTNIARVLEKGGEPVRYLDCDVEEPNGHLFLTPEKQRRQEVTLLSPVGVDENKCTSCGRCVKACNYNALALIKDTVLFFKNLCHICGACALVCPKRAILEKQRKIGELVHGKSGAIDVYYALLETGEGGMAPRLIQKVKENSGAGINILDSPPGTSCPVVETVKDADLCVLVTDPTPFGINDVKLAVDMCRELGKEPVLIVNRAEYQTTDLKDYCRQEELEIIGEIPDERRIAECYSAGGLAVDRFPEYFTLFRELADRILERAGQKKAAQKSIARPEFKKTAAGDTGRGVPRHNEQDLKNIQCPVPQAGGTAAEGRSGTAASSRGAELVVISGKGGTGKTSLVAAFCALEKNLAIADCDVDAADLRLVLSPEHTTGGPFSGGKVAVIDKDRCAGCGACAAHCRFDALKIAQNGGRPVYVADELSCEGCGVCALVCGFKAVGFKTVVNGEWYLSETRFGPMSHAKLGIAAENSGKLVALIRDKKNREAAARHLTLSIIDGSPGTGCPVIASVTGTDYALVVTEPTVSGIHDLTRVLDVINYFGIRSGIIVNKSDLNPGKSEEIKKIAERSGSVFLGRVPYAKAFTRAQLAGVPVMEYEDSALTENIARIWQKVKQSLFSAG
jgi:MinD superfamily P-loop ATPase